MSSGIDKVVAGKVADARARLLGELLQVVADDELSEHRLAAVERKLRRLERLKEALPGRKPLPVWIAPLSVGVVAVSAVGAALLVKLQNPEVHVDAHVSMLSFVVAADDNAFFTANDIPIKTMEVIGQPVAEPLLKNVASINRIQLLPGTQVELAYAGGCTTLQTGRRILLDDRAHPTGLKVTVLYAGNGADAQMPDELSLASGTTLRFCARNPPDGAIFGNVRMLDLSHVIVVDQSSGRILRSATIAKGSLVLPEVGRSVALTDADRLSLMDISDGWIAITPGSDLRVMFSGHVSRPYLVDIQPSGTRTPLSPSLAEWLRNSPAFASLVGMSTGFAGLLWTVLSYFRSSR